MDAVDATYPFLGKRTGHRIAIALVAILPVLATGWAIVSFWGVHVTWLDIALLLGFQTIAGLGITVGFHRMLAHGALKAKAPVRFLILLAAVTSFQGGPASWAATHRRHHALSDKEGDPHSPLDGLWHAHFGWLPKGRLVHSGPAFDKMMRDPVVAFLERTQLVWMLGSVLAPGAIALAITGSWIAAAQGLVWGAGVRIFLVHHITWSINSICHTWGTRPYKSPDLARNNAIFGFLGWGEGWHNNHHAFPNSAYIGHRWYQFDAGKLLIKGLAALRLVSHVHVPTKQERQARLARTEKRTAKPNPA